MQSPVVASDALVTLANWVYIWGHWPVILATASILYVLRRERYYLLRNAMFVSGLLGFVFFALFPVAPPRMLELGLVDTVTEQSNAYRALQPPGLTNQYAAFPSLHAGWNVLVGIVLVLAFTSWIVRALAVALPCLDDRRRRRHGEPLRRGRDRRRRPRPARARRRDSGSAALDDIYTGAQWGRRSPTARWSSVPARRRSWWRTAPGTASRSCVESSSSASRWSRLTSGSSTGAPRSGI